MANDGITKLEEIGGSISKIIANLLSLKAELEADGLAFEVVNVKTAIEELNKASDTIDTRILIRRS